MTTTTHPRSRRWTPGAIRRATPFPKPRGAIDKITCPLDALHTVTSAERRLLDYIASRADRIDTSGIEPIYGVDPATAWLLVPLEPHMLWLLEQFGAAADDLEHDFEEDDSEREPDVDQEPDLGACENVSQVRWGMPQERGHIVDAEREDELFDDGDDEPDATDPWIVPLYWPSAGQQDPSLPDLAGAGD